MASPTRGHSPASSRYREREARRKRIAELNGHSDSRTEILNLNNYKFLKNVSKRNSEEGKTAKKSVGINPLTIFVDSLSSTHRKYLALQIRRIFRRIEHLKRHF